MTTEPTEARILAYPLVRWTLIILGLVALAGVVSYVVASTVREDRYESVAKIAFIEDTRFDYVDAERDRLVGHTMNDAGSDLLATDGVESVSFVRPERETFLDVEVRANDPMVAADVANELAELIVDRDLAIRLEPIDSEIAARRNLIERVDTAMAGLESEIEAEAAREAFAEANRFDGDVATLEQLTIELRDAQDSFWLLVREKNSLGEQRIDNTARITELETRRETAQAETRVVQQALPSESPLRPSPLDIALLAAAAVAIVATTGALLLASSTGRRSSR